MSKNLETKIGKVRAFLEDGNTITSWKAIELFHCTRLSAVIYALRNDYGMAIADKESMKKTRTIQSIGLLLTPPLRTLLRTIFLMVRE